MLQLMYTHFDPASSPQSSPSIALNTLSINTPRNAANAHHFFRKADHNLGNHNSSHPASSFRPHDPSTVSKLDQLTQSPHEYAIQSEERKV
jgi:hypothetical protein